MIDCKKDLLKFAEWYDKKMKIEEFKKQFHSGSKLHFNNGGLAPVTQAASEKIKYWAERFYQEGFYTDHDYMSDVFQARSNLARLIGCAHEEIAFFQSTASAVSQVAFNLDLKPEDEVIMWAQEYASHLYPWQEACKRSGATLVLVESPEDLSTPAELIINAITPKTKVVAVSWVQFQTGAMTDLKKISAVTREKNIFLFSDIIQGLGVHPFSMHEMGVDAVAGGSHKWLFSPVGVGYLALASKHMSAIKPHNVGAYTFGTCDDPTDLVCMPKKNALKFEAGSKQVLEITALGASLDLLLKVGITEIERETLRLSGLLRSGLEKRGYKVHSPYPTDDHRSAMVNFIPKNDTVEKLRALPCNFALRGPGLRLTPAVFCTDEQIECIISVL